MALTEGEIQREVNGIVQEASYSIPYPYEFSRSTHQEIADIAELAESFLSTWTEPVEEVRLNRSNNRIEFLVEIEDEDGCAIKTWISE